MGGGPFSEAPGYSKAVREDGAKPGLFTSVKMLCASHPSIFINLSRSQRSTLAAFLARIPCRACWSESGGSLFGTSTLSFPRLQGTQAERNRSLIQCAFPEFPDPGFVPYRPRIAALAKRDRMLEKLPDLARGYIGLSVGAASHNKRPAPGFLLELGRIAHRAGLGVVVFGGIPEDAELARPILEGIPGALDRTGAMPLSERAAWVAGAKAFLTGDTGLGHVAAAAGVPTLVIFGPTTPEKYLPVGPCVEALVPTDLPCLGCGQGGCPLPGIPCMSSFSPPETWERMEKLIKQNPAGAQP